MSQTTQTEEGQEMMIHMSTSELADNIITLLGKKKTEALIVWLQLKVKNQCG